MRLLVLKRRLRNSIRNDGLLTDFQLVNYRRISDSSIRQLIHRNSVGS